MVSDIASPEGTPAFLHIGCGQTGDGCLDWSGAECKGNSVDRKYHLVNAQSFGPDGPGQKYAIEETENPAQESGGCKQESSGD